MKRGVASVEFFFIDLNQYRPVYLNKFYFIFDMGMSYGRPYCTITNSEFTEPTW